MPCLAVHIFSSNLRAGASRYIVSATSHTGQLGCQTYAWGLVYNTLESVSTESSIEDVKYCRRCDGIWIESHLRKITAQWTDGSFSVSGDKWGCSCLAAKYKVWVTSLLSGRASDQSITPEWPRQHLKTKNVGIIYKIENGYWLFDCIKSVLHTVEHSSLINTRHIVIQR